MAPTKHLLYIGFSLVIFICQFIPCAGVYSKDIIRPEEIKSLRLVCYDQATYAKLAQEWNEYYKAYPSEYAYANWMRAADYAKDSSFWDLLDKGLKKYPANPMLLYLKALEHAGSHNNTEARGYLERAAALDPDFLEPRFALVPNYMDIRDEERLNLTLRHLLEAGAIPDEVMDYNYNMISVLEPNAILISNGDNDTFPGWILTRILKFRPDVAVINRSLLNTDWYPLYVIEQGLPRFVEPSQIDSIKNSILDAVKKGKRTPSVGIFSDTLISRIIESAKTAGRPVYFAATLYITDELKELDKNGRRLGLATLVSPSSIPYDRQLQEVLDQWVKNFRTEGLDSWRLQYSPDTDAGRLLVKNYGHYIAGNLDSIHEYAPQIIVPLFDWYVRWAEKLGNEEDRGKIAKSWCRFADIKEIKDWCKKQGLGN